MKMKLFSLLLVLGVSLFSVGESYCQSQGQDDWDKLSVEKKAKILQEDNDYLLSDIAFSRESLVSMKDKYPFNGIGAQLRTLCSVKKDEKCKTIVSMVLLGSPAEKAGLKSGDKIMSVNGSSPENVGEAVNLIQSSTGAIKLVIRRGEANLSVNSVKGLVGEELNRKLRSKEKDFLRMLAGVEKKVRKCGEGVEQAVRNKDEAGLNKLKEEQEELAGELDKVDQEVNRLLGEFWIRN